MIRYLLTLLAVLTGISASTGAVQARVCPQDASEIGVPGEQQPAAQQVAAKTGFARIESARRGPASATPSPAAVEPQPRTVWLRADRARE